MKDYITIKKTDIFEASTLKYSHMEDNYLVIDEEYNGQYCVFEGENQTGKCYLRKVILVNKKFIDIETGNELFLLNNTNGLVEPPILRNTIYIVNLYKPINVTDQDLIDAYNAYKIFTEKQKIINEKKLVLFPQERIY